MDMDAERDIIKYNVLPLLNDRYREVIELTFSLNGSILLPKGFSD